MTQRKNDRSKNGGGSLLRQHVQENFSANARGELRFHPALGQNGCRCITALRVATGAQILDTLQDLRETMLENCDGSPVVFVVAIGVFDKREIKQLLRRTRVVAVLSRMILIETHILLLSNTPICVGDPTLESSGPTGRK